jgi:hypothetical protein
MKSSHFLYSSVLPAGKSIEKPEKECGGTLNASGLRMGVPSEGGTKKRAQQFANP